MNTHAWVARIVGAATRTGNYEEDKLPDQEVDLLVGRAPLSLVADRNPDISYQLDRQPELLRFWGEFCERRKRHLEDQKWLDTYKDKLAAAMGDRTQLYVGNDKVAVYERDGQYTWKQFEEDNPHLVEEYTREVTKTELDKKAVLEAYPGLLAMYKARTLRVK